MLTLKEKLGLRIKSLRKKSGLSQEMLAELINMDKPNLSNIERGKRFMTAETLEKIAKALNTTERELFDFSESIPQKYFRADIEKFLDNFEEKDLKFILDVMVSYSQIQKDIKNI
ncbi:MAG: helix-turn-helix domain-containing protein [bacterium]|nr:helix-turn-helix domain-containing protein [bacterium]